MLFWVSVSITCCAVQVHKGLVLFGNIYFHCIWNICLAVSHRLSTETLLVLQQVARYQPKVCFFNPSPNIFTPPQNHYEQPFPLQYFLDKATATALSKVYLVSCFHFLAPTTPRPPPKHTFFSLLQLFFLTHAFSSAQV